MLFSKDLRMFALTFKSSKNFEAVFVYVVRLLQFHCLHVGVQFSLYHFLEIPNFIFPGTFTKLICHRNMELFLHTQFYTTGLHDTIPTHTVLIRDSIRGLYSATVICPSGSPELPQDSDPGDHTGSFMPS